MKMPATNNLRNELQLANAMQKNFFYIRLSIISQDQYIFVHMAVYEALSCGNTEIEAHYLRRTLKVLSTVDKDKNKTGFALEFQVIKRRIFLCFIISTTKA